MTVATYRATPIHITEYNRRHDWTHQLIRLIKARRLYMQPVCRYTRESAIIEHDDRVRMVRETLEGKEGVVRLHHDVGFLVVREDGVSLDQLFGKAVVEPFEDVGAET